MPSDLPCCCTQSTFLFPGGSGWTRVPPGVPFPCCLPEALPVAEGCASGAGQEFVREKRRLKLEIVIHFIQGCCWQGTLKPLMAVMLQVPRASLAPVKCTHFKICPWISPPNTRFAIMVSHVKPDWLKKGRFVLVFCQFFETIFPTCVSSWQSWSPNTLHLLIAPANSRKNTKILIWSITANISQDPNIDRDFSKQLAEKEWNPPFSRTHTDVQLCAAILKSHIK